MEEAKIHLLIFPQPSLVQGHDGWAMGIYKVTEVTDFVWKAVQVPVHCYTRVACNSVGSTRQRLR